MFAISVTSYVRIPKNGGFLIHFNKLSLWLPSINNNSLRTLLDRFSKCLTSSSPKDSTSDSNKLICYGLLLPCKANTKKPSFLHCISFLLSFHFWSIMFHILFFLLILHHYIWYEFRPLLFRKVHSLSRF